ncbi:hypothetical protein F4809DRAFT_611811 [Biscogniauxia mediterranea]|nr:hypothetical protein F4809DRAFT_611811 [Biscogniauxia mediterranea]
MVAIRMSKPWSTSTLRATRTLAPRAHRTFVTSHRYQAPQGYGDAKGDPVAEDPKQQPETSKAQESLEHPGPEPPDVGKGTGGAPTKAAFSKNMNKAASGKSPEDASAQSGGSRSKEATETGGSPTGGDIANAASQNGGEALKGPQGKGKPRPKIYNQAVPGTKSGLSEEQKREVEDHNASFEKRHDRASPAENDKVDKKFWQGT